MNPVVNQNVDSRKASEHLFKTMIECVRDDYRKLDQHGKRCFCELALAKFSGMLGLNMVGLNHEQPAEKTRKLNQEVEEALELCEEVISACQYVPDAGADFASSVECSCRDVMATIESTQNVTQPQWRAMENWLEGLNRWRRD